MQISVKELVELIASVNNVAISAIKKQIPVGIEYYGVEHDYNGEIDYDTVRCPICGSLLNVDDDDHDSYCPTCGQALDWSDEDA